MASPSVCPLQGAFPSSGHGSGYHVRLRAFAVEPHVVFADGPLIPVGHQPFPNRQPGVRGQLRDGGPLRIVDALDLDHLHLDAGSFLLIDLGHRVQDALALSVAGSVVFLHVADMRVLPHVETVDAVMLAVLVSAVVDAAPGDDDHVRVLADEEIVVDRFLQSAFGHDDRDMNAFMLGARFDPDLQPADILLRRDLDVRRGLPARTLAVGSDVVGPFRNLVQIRHFPQQPHLCFVEFHHASLPPSAE